MFMLVISGPILLVTSSLLSIKRETKKSRSLYVCGYLMSIVGLIDTVIQVI